MRADVAAMCRRLADGRRPIELEPVRASDAAGRMFSVIERVDDDGLIIARPTGPGAHRSLIQFASYTMVLPDGMRAVAADVKVLARTKMKGGQNATLYCYKVSLPVNPREVARSEEQRSLVGVDIACEASIRAVGHARPMYGMVERINADEATIRCRATVALPVGASVHIDAELPPPVGSLTAVGAISSIGRGEPGEGPRIRVKFIEPVPAIKDALTTRRRTA